MNSKRSKCSMCGKCCREYGHGLTITPGDYRRWKHQGREDILRYAWVPKGLGGYGDIWIDPEIGEDLDYCPFLERVSQRKYICAIHDTRPKVCREFWCEYVYGVGKKPVPFRRMNGWTERARELGYGQANNSLPHNFV